MGASLVLTVDRRPEAARVARDQVRALCAGRTPYPLIDDVLLVVSELVTNAVLHGTGTITLQADVSDGQVAIGVSDEGIGTPRAEVVDQSAPHGRGIAMVARLAKEWGVEPDPSGGKTVWCLLDADGTQLRPDRDQVQMPTPVRDLISHS
jgi:anti-sigma regulatory factor (Ser/Thr protein kinase)